MIAQTNPQLLLQLQRQAYPDSALVAVQRAYLLALGLADGLYRGCGKPFVCHLVGTASIVAHCGAPVSVIVAALLHASYQPRVIRDAPGGLSACRERIAAVFGPACEKLVYGYQFKDESAPDAVDDAADRASVTLLHLADGLEDLIDCAPMLHGTEFDGADVRGSAGWRLAQAAQTVPAAALRARALGYAWLAQQLEQWLARNQQCRLPTAVRTGALTSVSSFTVPGQQEP